MRAMKQKITDVQLHLENTTEKNISILAESHLVLIDKINESVKAAGAAEENTVYRVQVHMLTDRVGKLEKAFAESQGAFA